MHTTANGPAQPDRATKEKAREDAGQNTQNSIDYPPSPKEFSTWQARFALLGYALVLLGDGEYLAARWNFTRHLADLAAVENFYRQIGGANV